MIGIKARRTGVASLERSARRLWLVISDTNTMTPETLYDRFLPLAALFCAIAVFVGAVLDMPAGVDAGSAPAVVAH